MKTSTKFPHVPQRRDGENRLIREADDILLLFTCLDENKLMDKLPRYVADGPDSMPSLRLYEGDMNVFLLLLEKMNTKLQEFGLALSTITRDVGALQSKLITVGEFPSIQQVYGPATSTTAAQRQSTDGVRGNSTNIETENGVMGQPTSLLNSDWATIACTPYAHENRFAPLASATDDESTAQPFDVARPRRNKRLRIKTPPQQSTTANTQQQRPEQQRPAATRSSTVFGKSTTATNISAARKLRKKKVVYCIDNGSTDCSLEDIKDFVSGLSVDVISCFEAKPRRRRGEDVVNDRKAFRLCIGEDDRDRLLNEAAWPDSVTISEWFFKSTSTSNEQDRRSTTDTASGAVVDQPIQLAGHQLEVVATVHCESVNDDTIIVACRPNTENMDCAVTDDHGE